MTHNVLQVFEDCNHNGEWRFVDEDGGCYVTIFAGPVAEQRARVYYDALKGGTLEVIRDQRVADRPRLSTVIQGAKPSH
jgi:hypothetical protein